MIASRAPRSMVYSLSLILWILEAISAGTLLLLGEYNPKRWLNGYQVDETEIVKVLVIGDSYIIGEAFDFKKL